MMFMRNLIVYIGIFALIIIRIFSSDNQWFSSIVLSGFMIALFDLLYRAYYDNKDVLVSRKKQKAFLFCSALIFLFIISMFLLIINLFVGINWMKSDMAKDIITLLTLLIGLQYKHITNAINNCVKK